MEAESKNEIKEAASEFFGWDKRIINTFRDMLTRPGEAVLESLENPHKYISPWIYFFAIETVYFFIANMAFKGMVKPSTFTTFTTDILMRFDIRISSATSDTVFQWLSGESGKRIFLPFALLFQWIFFKKYYSGFKGNSTFYLYTTPTPNLIMICVMSAIFLLTGTDLKTESAGLKIFVILSGIVLVLTYFYFLWATIAFYKIRWWRAVLLNLVIILLLSITQEVVSVGYALVLEKIVNR